MPVRPEARANLIADALVRCFNRISKEREPLMYLSTPKAVRRGILIIGPETPKPSLMIQTLDWKDTPAMNVVEHDGVMHFAVHCIADLGKADEELNRIASDVVYAISADHYLTNAAGEKQVTFVHATGYTVQADVMDRVAEMGFAIGTVFLEAMYAWTHDAP